MLTFVRALVLYNAAAAALAAPPDGPYATLRIGGNQLTALCYNALQQTVLAMPGRDIDFVQGSILLTQLMTHRPSYVNRSLI
jgi:hypothetical protein